MKCKYCNNEINDEFEFYITKPKLENPIDPSSEVIYEYAHLDCYIRHMLQFLGLTIQDKLKWWVENP